MSGGWVLAFVLLLASPDGRAVEAYGRDGREFATREACVAALERFHPALLPQSDRAGRVVAFSAGCFPVEPPETPPARPAPRPSERVYAA